MNQPWKHPLTRAAAWLVAAVLLAACGATPQATSAPPIPVPASDTPAPVSPSPAPTVAAEPSATEAPLPAATDTAMPSATPSPAAVEPTPAAQRITFAAGTTSAALEGSLPAHTTGRFVLRVMAGQLLDVQADPEDRLQLVVYGADGTVLKSPMGEGATFRGTVPTTQDYVLELNAGDQAVSYHLQVIIPVRISFAPGATSAVVEGQLAAGQVTHYVLHITGGQLLDVQADPQDRLQLVVYGADGTVLKSAMGGGPVFRGPVPSTQDYLLALSATEALSFNLNVMIPERISFAPGGTSASLEGHLAAFGAHHYILAALGGQTMQVQAAPEGQVRLIIYGVDGTVLMSGMGGGASFSGILPSDQDYIVVVSAGPAPADYTLDVSIE
jgi:hypothetical protein